MKVLRVSAFIYASELDAVFNAAYQFTAIPFRDVKPGIYPISERCIEIGGSTFNAVVFSNMLKGRCAIVSQSQLAKEKKQKSYTSDRKKKNSWSNTIYGSRFSERTRKTFN